MSIITNDSYVMLVNDNSKEFKCVQVPKRQKVYIKPFSFSPNAVIGHQYGCKFNVSNGNLVLSQSFRNPIDVAENCSKTNEFIMDDMKSQALSQSDIISMKDQGIRGEEIIENLVQNSTSFNEKTEFSKAKWMKKKLTKHVPIIVVYKPSVRRICSSASSKIRPDLLAKLINNANIWGDCKVIVLECRDDLITSAVAEHTHEKASIFQIFEQRFPHVLFTNWLNLMSAQKESIKYYPLKFLSFISSASDPANKFDELVKESIKQSQKMAHLGKRKRVEEEPEMTMFKKIAIDICQGDLDSLIMSTSYDCVPALEVLYQYLKSSGKVVIHHDNLGVILECANFLQKSGCAEISIVDHWFREIQVLAGRTHPDMRMQGGGGFILTCTKIQSGIYVHGSDVPVSTRTNKVDGNILDTDEQVQENNGPSQT